MRKNLQLKISTIIFVIIFSLNLCIIPAGASTKEVIIGGEPFGLKLYCKGVMVTGFSDFETESGMRCPGIEDGLRLNDIITSADGKDTKSIEKFEKIIRTSNEKSIRMKVLRNEKERELTVLPLKDSDGIYRAGIWIKDSCAGIGTISYYDTERNVYGALGHGICDPDSGGLISCDKGEILTARITSVTRSEDNKIGTLNGYFTENVIGNIKNNTDLGISGEISEEIKGKKLPVASADKLSIGKAFMYSTIHGNAPEKYEIEIERICNTHRFSNKNFVVRVTDKRLLNKTGGIVQGMSGSPIVQDGKFVGALTHVFLEDCERGYGILAENMIN